MPTSARTAAGLPAADQLAGVPLPRRDRIPLPSKQKSDVDASGRHSVPTRLSLSMYVHHRLPISVSSFGWSLIRLGRVVLPYKFQSRGALTSSTVRRAPAERGINGRVHPAVRGIRQPGIRSQRPAHETGQRPSAFAPLRPPPVHAAMVDGLAQAPPGPDDPPRTHRSTVNNASLWI